MWTRKVRVSFFEKYLWYVMVLLLNVMWDVVIKWFKDVLDFHYQYS